MSGDLTGYTALVTGSTAGLGLAIAEELGLRGAGCPELQSSYSSCANGP